MRFHPCLNKRRRTRKVLKVEKTVKGSVPYSRSVVQYSSGTYGVESRISLINVTSPLQHINFTFKVLILDPGLTEISKFLGQFESFNFFNSTDQSGPRSQVRRVKETYTNNGKEVVATSSLSQSVPSSSWFYFKHIGCPYCVVRSDVLSRSTPFTTTSSLTVH